MTSDRDYWKLLMLIGFWVGVILLASWGWLEMVK